LYARRAEQAIPILEELLKKSAAPFGPDRLETLSCHSDLGYAYLADGRTAQAVATLEEALRHIVMVLGPDDLFTLGTRNRLVAAYYALGRRAQAESLIRNVPAHEGRSAPLDTLALAGYMAFVGAALLQHRQWSEAESVLRECLKIREAKLSDDWSRFSTMSQLGGALLGQGRYAESESLVIRGYEGLKAREAKIPPPGKARLPEAAGRVVALYEAWGKPELVARWRVRLGRDWTPSELPADVFDRP
jgi:tetratricopeptide (TPR) repeat protein